MLKTTGLIAGHYECRSLTETLPVFTDLLAMEVERKQAGEAILKHPNTEWRLIVHEGGPNAPDKGFDNHYGFRVGSHEEVAAAWQYIEAHKEQYRLSKITKPQSAHFAYSIYFREPGGNHLEIEYYNPGGALHGRSHTAGHWEKPLTAERFPERGYLPQAFPINPTVGMKVEVATRSPLSFWRVRSVATITGVSPHLEPIHNLLVRPITPGLSAEQQLPMLGRVVSISLPTDLKLLPGQPLDITLLPAEEPVELLSTKAVNPKVPK